MVAALVPGEGFHVLEKSFADMLPAGLLMDAEVVHIEGGQFLKASAPLVLHGAEGIAQHLPAPLIHENRRLRILKNGQQLLVRVFLSGLPEKVRAPPVMNGQNLPEKPVHGLQVPFFRLPDSIHH